MDQEDMDINQVNYPINSSPVSNHCIQNEANSSKPLTSVTKDADAHELRIDFQPSSQTDDASPIPSISRVGNSKDGIDDVSSVKLSNATVIESEMSLKPPSPQAHDENVEETLVGSDGQSDMDYSADASTEKETDNIPEPSRTISPSEISHSTSDHPDVTVTPLISTEEGVQVMEKSSPLISSPSSDKGPSFPQACLSPISSKETPNVENMQSDLVESKVMTSDAMSTSSTHTSTPKLSAACDRSSLPEQSQTHQSTSCSSEAMDPSDDAVVHNNNSPSFSTAANINVQSELSSSTTSNTTKLSSSVSTSAPSSSTSNLDEITSAEILKSASPKEGDLNHQDENVEDRDYESGPGESDVHQDSVFPAPCSSKNEDSCKILTKYIFINKPAKVKVSKKKLGFLYKQAFRHYQRSKVSPSAGKISSLKEKKPPKKVREVSKKRSSRKTPIKKKSKKNQSEKQSTKSKRKAGKTERKTTVRKYERKPKAIKEETVSCRKSSRKRGKKTSAPRYVEVDSDAEEYQPEEVKSKKRKTLSLSNKVEIINHLESPSSTFSSVARNFNVGKSSLTRIFKQKDKILADFEEKEKKKTKLKEKLEKRKNLHKVLDIKEERPDHDSPDNDEGMNLPCPDDFSLDPGSSAFFNKEIGNKNRKELTLQEKVWMIRELEKPGAKNRHVAKKFGVSSSAVSRIRKCKDILLSRALSGDVCQQMRRTRECKDPVLDRVLLKWYRALEALKDHPISVSNTLLQDKSRDLAIAMGTSYFPSVNWIIRWKYRHNIRCKSGRIESKEALDELDANVDIAEIITAVEGQPLYPIKTELQRPVTVCEHCGIIIRCKRDRRSSNHLKTCPLAAQAHRRDLTLGEKAQVVRALEKPGVKMITLAKKYGVSSSAISRMHKNRVDILARCADAYVNTRRKRERVSKEPEVERSLCEWYTQQQEYGYHVSSSSIREKAHEIAALMGKDFWPSDSWVFRWRHRNNINAIGTYDEIEDTSLNDDVTEETGDNTSEITSNVEGQDEDAQAVKENEEESGKKKKKRKGKAVKVKEDIDSEVKVKIKLPRSVMCEKCGCVSDRLKNKRVCGMRHAKGCPDLKPRNELTYQERIKMLKALEEPGATLSSVARQYGVSASSMSRMNQKRNSIMANGVDYAGQKRIRDCKEPEVAKLLFVWYTEKQKEGIHVTGAKLKEKAGEYAREMGREFKASTGWLGRWKHRYNIIFRKDETKIGKDLSKKKVQKRKNNTPFKQEEVMETAETAEENNHDEVNEQAPSVLTIMPDESQPLQAPRMFLNQRYQTPWTINHQPSPSCSRPKEFMPGPNHGMPEESHVPYAYDHMPRPMFHNVFENFTGAANYPVPMVEPNVPVRDYLQPDENEAHQAGSTHHPIIPHQPPPLNLHASGLAQHHPAHHHQHQLHQAAHTSSISSSSVSHDDENLQLQQQQIMEACRLMNSFAKEKSLGEHVHAALRTIEMTLKDRKGPPRSSYTNI